MHKVQAKTLLNSQNGMNLYRGCTYGCIYCDSRSACYQMNHAFEDIEVKENAPLLLERALKAKRKRCMIGTGSMSDPYMPLEKELGLTRRCLEIIDRYGYGGSVITKSDLVLRDLDLIKSIHKKSKFVVQMTLTTANDELCKILEPNVCPTSRRIEVLQILEREGIPTVVWLCPFLPYINDDEKNFRALLQACVQAKVKGILCFGIGLTLRNGNREYFYEKLDQHFPGLKEIYMRKYGNSYMVNSDNHNRLMRIFEETCRKHHILYKVEDVFQYLQEYPEKFEQLSLF
ncbi:MAG: radical SAM protein [Bacillota bacterium]|nr:radical SAM protein [Bacillota bacterium]